MRRSKIAWAVLLALGLVLGACRFGWCAPGCRAGAAPLVWSDLSPDDVSVLGYDHHHWTRFGIPLPAVCAAAGPVRRIELRFSRSLEGAKVDAYGYGPWHTVTLLDGYRTRANALAIALPPLTLDRVEVVVVHHRRLPPSPPWVRLGREGR